MSSTGCRLAWVLLAVAAIGRAQAPRELASYLPSKIALFVEVEDVPRLIDLVRSSPLLDLAPPPGRTRFLGALDAIAASGAKRLAAGVTAPGLGGKPHLVLLIHGAPRAAVEKALAALFPGHRVPVADLGACIAASDDEDLVGTTVEIAGGDGQALAAQAEFQAFRRKVTAGLVRLHADVGSLAPFRGGIGRPKDLGAALFATHLLGVLATAKVVDGAVHADSGLRLHLTAKGVALAPARAFAAPPTPTLPALAPPAGCAAELSLPRDLSGLWEQRDALAGESGRSKLAEFQNNAGILLGGLPMEDVVAGLGHSFDLYLARLPEFAPPPAHRFPGLALVAEVKTARLKQELVLGFQTTLGVVNADRAQKGEPRLLQESSRYRDVLMVSATWLPDTLPTAGDDRRQLEPALAIVGDRLILGTSPRLVRALIDQALDQHTTPRTAGDRLRIHGPDAATLIRDAADFLAGKQVLEEGRTPEEAATIVSTLARVIEQLGTATAAFRIVRDRAEFDLTFDAAAAESRR